MGHLIRNAHVRHRYFNGAVAHRDHGYRVLLDDRRRYVAELPGTAAIPVTRGRKSFRRRRLSCMP